MKEETSENTALEAKLYPEERNPMICRLCFMKKDQLELIFDGDKDYFSEWIEKLTSLKIVNIPNAPRFLCSDCKSTLVAFETFREMCLTNNLVFSRNIDQTEVNTECLNGVQENNMAIEREIIELESVSNCRNSINVDGYEITIRDTDENVEAENPIPVMVLHDTCVNGETGKTGKNGTDRVGTRTARKEKSSEKARRQSRKRKLKWKMARETDRLVDEQAVTSSKYLCETCDKYASELHALTHRGDQHFQCYECPKKFRFLSYLREHIDEWHATSKNISKDVDQPMETNTGIGEHTIQTLQDKADQEETINTPAPTQMLTHEDYETAIIKQSIEIDSSVEDDESESEEGNRPNSVSSEHLVIAEQIPPDTPTYERVDEIKIEEPTLHIDLCDDTDDSVQSVQDVKEDNELLAINNMSASDQHACNVCGKTGTETHYTTHKSDGMFHCYSCPKKFTKYEYIRKHLNVHLKNQRAANNVTVQNDNQTVVQSLACDFQQSVDSNSCELSNESAAISDTPELSNETYIDQGPGLGEDKFASIRKRVKDRYLAMSKKDKITDSDMATCKICQKFAPKLHVKTHKAKGLYRCYICGGVFDKFKDLSKHKMIHSRK